MIFYNILPKTLFFFSLEKIIQIKFPPAPVNVRLSSISWCSVCGTACTTVCNSVPSSVVFSPFFLLIFSFTTNKIKNLTMLELPTNCFDQEYVCNYLFFVCIPKIIINAFLKVWVCVLRFRSKASTSFSIFFFRPFANFRHFHFYILKNNFDKAH